MEYDKEKHQYDAIINLPPHQSAEHAHMPIHDRAAQFAPFSALSGHEDAINETARLTDDKIVLDETQVERINEKICVLAEHLSEKTTVAITYFRPDLRKEGGTYLTDIGVIKKIDEMEQVIVMENGMKISMTQIVGIEERE